MADEDDEDEDIPDDGTFKLMQVSILALIPPSTSGNIWGTGITSLLSLPMLQKTTTTTTNKKKLKTNLNKSRNKQRRRRKKNPPKRWCRRNRRRKKSERKKSKKNKPINDHSCQVFWRWDFPVFWDIMCVTRYDLINKNSIKLWMFDIFYTRTCSVRLSGSYKFVDRAQFWVGILEKIH